jgi:hypothetical protein
MNKILIALVLAFVSIGANAQSLKIVSNRDSMYYLYLLTKPQIEYIRKTGTIKDTNFLQQQITSTLNKSFAETPDSLKPYGTYLEARIVENKIYYGLCSKTPFTITIKKINEDIILFVKDNVSLKHLLIADATITYHNAQALYNSGYGGYVVPKIKLRKKEVLSNVNINYEGKDYLYAINKTPEPIPYQGYRGGSGKISPYLYGYFICDKPKYKPKDTLRLKAFLLSRDGKGETTTLILNITDNKTNKQVYRHKLEPIKAGAYIHEFVLPDTFKIDRQYTVSLNHKSLSTSKSCTFLLEDYVLDKSLLNCTTAQTNLFSGDSIVLNLSTSDANGFALSNVKCTYKLGISGVTNLHTDSLRISKTKFTEWISVDTILPYNTKHQFVIKASQLPPISGTYILHLSLIDAQFEQKNFVFNYTVNNKPEQIFMVQDEDTLRINYTNKGVPQGKDFKLYCSNAYGIKRDSVMVTTPFAMKLKSEYKAATLIEKDNVVAAISLSYNVLQLLNVQGTKGARQTQISFKYPFDEMVYYKIYKGKEIVKSGQGKNLEFTTTDSSLTEYKILVATNFDGYIENNTQWYYFYSLNKKLSVTSNLPADAFPGQTVPITFEVRDFYGKPMRDINLAAYAVNSMFADAISEPYLDVPTKFNTASKSIAEAGTYQYLSLQQITAIGIHSIKPKHIVRYNLYKNDYYKLLYPGQGIANVARIKQKPDAELMVSIVKDGQFFAPKYVKLNGNLMYITNLCNARQYSNIVDAGKYVLQVRAFDLLMQTNITVSAGAKNFVSINLDSVYAKQAPAISIVQDSMNRMQPSANENAEIEKSCLLLTNLQIDSALVIRNTKVSAKQYKYTSNYLPTVRVEEDEYNVILPYNIISTTQLCNGRNTYYLNTGRKFHFYNQNTKAFEEKQFYKNSPYIFSFTEQQLSPSDLAFMIEPDTAEVLPMQPIQQVPMQENKTVVRFEPWRYVFNPSYYANERWSMRIFEGKRKVTACWIVDEYFPRKSIFANSSGAQLMNSFSIDAPVDIYIFYTDNRFTKLNKMSMRSFDNFYVHTDSIASTSFTEKDLSKALTIFETITRAPYSAFYEAPQEQQGMPIEISGVSNENNKAYLRGMVTNDALQPVPNAHIIIENNGRYVTGATSNNIGAFEILNLTAGTYDVKVFNAMHQYKYYYSVQLGGQQTQIATIKLTHRNTTHPKYEAINNNFRYAASTDTATSYIINAYSERTRQALKIRAMTVAYKSGIVKEIQVNNTSYTLAKTIATDISSITVHVAKHNSVMLYGFVTTSAFKHVAEFFMTDSNGLVEQFNMYPTAHNNYYVDYAGNTIKLEAQEKDLEVYGYDLKKNSYSAAPSAMQVERLATTNASDAVALKANVFQPRNVTGVTMGGGRTAGTLTMVDGVVINSNVSLAYGSVEAVQIDMSGMPAVSNNYGEVTNYWSSGGSASPKSKKAESMQDELFNKLMNSDLAHQARSVFSDNAYWQPNFYTDKDGKATVTVTLPHNITNWKTFSIAFGEQFFYGIAKQNLRVYKPLQTITYTPSYLHKGDSATAFIKHSNLMDEPKTIDIYTEINKAAKSKSSIVLKNDYSDSAILIAKSLDTIAFEAGLHYQDKYSDAEFIRIPVYNTALLQYGHQAILMEADSTYLFNFGANTKGIITFNNNLYERIIQYTKNLEDYEYGCVEQTSSKLKAVVYQQIILSKIGKPTNKTKQINKLIKLLEDMQNNNGSFGWWRKGSADGRMTAYALEALLFAQKNGYNVFATEAAKDFLVKRLPQMPVNEKLYVLHMLCTNNLYSIKAKDIAEINTATISTTDKMYLYKLRMLQGEVISDNDIYTLCLEMNNRLRYCGYENFFDDERASVFKLFKIFKGTALEAQIFGMFKQKILNGALDKNLNTFSTASLIEALVEEAENNNKPLGSTLTINDTLKVISYPFSMPITSSTVRIKHVGSAVFAQSAEAFETYNPVVIDSIFRIETMMNNTNLKRGSKTNLDIKITAFKTKQYVMIEVPLPAGIAVENKNSIANGDGDYVEYYKNKIIIYKQVMPQGNTNLSIPILAKYSGKFQMPAARICMMYYPFVNGNNVDAVVEIRP